MLYRKVDTIPNEANSQKKKKKTNWAGMTHSKVNLPSFNK